jgi:hypothetical protein
MTHISVTDALTKFARKVIKSNHVIAIALVIALGLVAARPAQAQSNDTWKSVAIIGGSTAAGAIIGHKIGGATGAYVGAAAGAATGYAIDRRRRQNNEYNNGYYGGNYPNNGGYFPSNGGYYGNGYPSNSGSYPYQANNGYSRSHRGR